MICSVVLIQISRLMDGQTDGWIVLPWHIRTIAHMMPCIKTSNISKMVKDRATVIINTRIHSVERSICPIASLNVFLNVDHIVKFVTIIDGCGKFQPEQMNLVEFHIYVQMQ